MSVGAWVGIVSGAAVIVGLILGYARKLVLAPPLAEKARVESERAAADAACADAERRSTYDRERLTEIDAKYRSLQQDMLNLKLGKTSVFLKYEIDTVLSQAAESLGVVECSISLPGPPPNSSRFVFLSIHGPAAAKLRLAKLKVDDGIVGRVFASGTPHSTTHPYGDPHFFAGIDEKGNHRTQTLLTVPLIAGGEIVGVAQFLNEPGGFSQSDEATAVEFAGLLAGRVATFARDPENFELLGLAGIVEDEQATIAFCDLTAFSSFLEQMNAAAAVDCLNEYLEQQCDIAMRYGGTVEKYLGDGAMIRFIPARNSAGDNIVDAVEAAVEMQDEFRRLKESWVSSGLPVQDIHSRIGISCGIVHEAKLGHPQFQEVTVIGDAVNEASTLCESARRNGDVILVSGQLAGRLDGRFTLVPVPTEASGPSAVEVVGRA